MTKRRARREVNELVERCGMRLVLECVSDYCREHPGVNVWSARFEVAARLLADSAATSRRRRASESEEA